jgi:hypothetical protein
MAVSYGHIAALVVKIQNDFLDTPRLTLTLSQAQKRFGADEITCEAVLGALVDGKVLAKTPDGAYVRLFPRCAAGADAARGAKRPAVQHRALTTRRITGFAA